MPIPVTKRTRNRGTSQKHVNVALAIMALLIAIASVAVMRSYGSGVVTSPVIVIPYWMYARRVLREHG